MNILMIVGEKRPIPWSKGGAIQTYVDEVSKYLKNEHQLTILSTAYPSIGEEETFDSIRYVRSNLTVNEIQQFIQIESFDLIHIFNQARLIVPIREVAPDSKLVLSIHSNFFKREHFTRFEANEILQQLDHIITNNENITKTISTLFKIDRTKLKTIYSGVKIEQFSHQNTQQNQHIRKNIRSEYDISDKKVVLLTGQFSPNKGVDIFLEAIKQLADKYPNMALIMVSSQAYNDYHDGEYISYLRELAEKIQIPVFHSG
ncbi:glycosyltransferase family 4 protein [Bacillus sp. JCM 19034]|uniref:glycosyltransferase family 4 protein n=1 Tax=Bacillus sp. JCM 19034 TaxID=1481928 RepID=UPI00078579B2|nr:glycosyltransferase family 4 protein [Bacillus sp. JCM 19034]